MGRLFVAVGFAVAACSSALAQPPAQVVDLNAVLDPSPDADPHPILRFGTNLLFLACDLTAGCEPWVTDGTAVGTFRLVDANPGAGGSVFESTLEGRSAAAPTFAAFMLCTGGGIADCEPWRSDGTSAGTFRLKDVRPGNASSSPSYFTAVGSQVFFAADDGATGVELWKSDGTTSGTVQVEDIVPGTTGSGARHLAALGSTLIFQADKPAETGLWRSDGTAPGTFFYSPVEIRGTEEVGAADPIGPFSAELGGKIIFSGEANPADGNQLFITDGTAPGTSLLKGVPASASSAAPNGFRKLGTRLLFTAFNLNFDGHGVELWATDGTTAGTVELTGLVPGNNPSNPVAEPTVAGALLYFHNQADFELWKSDGTPGGTQIVEVNGAIVPNEISAVGSQVCFRATTAGEGFELWKSDGTAGGTERVTDLFPGTSDGAAGYTAGLGASCLFRGETATNGTELWQSDLSPANATMVKEIASVTSPSAPRDLVELGGKLYFSATDGIGGRELFVSDATAVGTARVLDLRPGAAGSDPTEIVRLGSNLLFAADDGSAGREIFRSDGTGGGTALHAEVAAGGAGSGPTGLTPFGADLYFVADDGTTGRELWRKTPSTLAQVADLVNPGSSNPRELTPFAGEIYFLADDAIGNIELWRSNGTTPGTTLVADLTALSGFDEHGEMRVGSGALRVVLYDTDTQTAAIWSSNGTLAGTTELVDLDLFFDGVDTIEPRNLTPLGSRFLFQSWDADAAGVELWTSDGSTPGTGVLDFTAEPPQSTRIVTLGASAFFDGQNDDFDVALWRSSGTTAGTTELLSPGPPAWEAFGALSAAAGRIYFSPSSGEPWTSDGTTPGTVALGAPQAGSAGVDTGFVAAGQHVFFAANDTLHGAELWAYRPSPIFADGFESSDTAAWSATVP